MATQEILNVEIEQSLYFGESRDHSVLGATETTLHYLLASWSSLPAGIYPPSPDGVWIGSPAIIVSRAPILGSRKRVIRALAQLEAAGWIRQLPFEAYAPSLRAYVVRCAVWVTKGRGMQRHLIDPIKTTDWQKPAMRKVGVNHGK